VRGRPERSSLAWQAADMTSPKLSIAYLLNTVNSDIDTPSSFFASSERSHVLDPTSSDDSSIDEPKTLQPANRKRKWDHACCATTTTSTSSTSTDRSLHATAQTQDCQTINHHNLNNHDDIRNNISSRKKRPLRRYSDEILDGLIAAYDVNSRPCEDTLMMLANQLGLSPYQVKTW